MPECWHHIKSRPPESIEEICQEYNMLNCLNKILDLQQFKLCQDKTKDIIVKNLPSTESKIKLEYEHLFL